MTPGRAVHVPSRAYGPRAGPRGAAGIPPLRNRHGDRNRSVPAHYVRLASTAAAEVSTYPTGTPVAPRACMATMRAAVFLEKGQIRLREIARPEPGPGQALLKVTLTTICGTDVHILKGEYPVKPGLTVGHEPVGTIEALGAGIAGFAKGDRVIVGAITPCGQCRACLSGTGSQCSHGGEAYEALGGWRFGNTINGCQAEYVLVPDAQANLAKIPDGLSDEDVVLCP